MDSHPLVEEVNLLHSDLCSALADPTRILIIYALDEKDSNVGELANLLGVSQPAASRHLKILRDRGLVYPIREGASMKYQLTDHRIIEALEILRKVLRDRLAYRASLMNS
jgi:DNA-binding transcriptional ArsR family regulator